MLQIQNSENQNLLFTALLVEELVRHNVTYFCISPGSRSAPLTIAAARHPKTATRIIYDERGAAFHALGYARAEKKPAVLICSSGTAAANYYPAVIEAFQENIPIIILSADRPAKLRNTGANQTIDQVNLYGKYTKFFIDLECPEVTTEASYILKIVDNAFYAATGNDAGPVHLNCQFNEPLALQKTSWPENYLSSAESWLQSNVPFKKKVSESRPIQSMALSQVSEMINQNPNGVIIVGRNEKPAEQKAILKLSEKTGWPIFADITSGLRVNSAPYVIHYFDILLQDELLRSKMSAYPILHFGEQFVSKRLLKFLENFQGEHIRISDSSKTIDPANSVSKHIQCSIEIFIEELLKKITKHSSSTFLEEIQKQNTFIGNEIASFALEHKSSINEISVINLIMQNISDNSSLFIASSMPIRDMDKFAQPVDKKINIAANRGASGIDGTIASASGFAIGSKKPTTLLIGDLAFIHDQSSLAMIAKGDIPIIIILINNQGGGIFSFLPIANHLDVFEENFGTPHNLSFKNLAEQYGLNYFTPKTANDFVDVYCKSQAERRAVLIEIKSNRAENIRFHKNLENRVKVKLL